MEKLLEENGMECYFGALTKSGVECVADLPYLSAKMIEKLGMPAAHREKLDMLVLNEKNKHLKKKEVNGNENLNHQIIIKKELDIKLNIVKDEPLGESKPNSPKIGSSSSAMPSSEEQLGDDDAFCGVCGGRNSEVENLIVFCDRCNVSVHQGCYGVAKLPAGVWLCKLCTAFPDTDTKAVACQLCSSREKVSAFEPVIAPDPADESGCSLKWAHALCCSMISEIGFANPEKGFGNKPTLGKLPSNIISICGLDVKRRRLKCAICLKVNAGDVGVQCSWKRCTKAVHPRCVLGSGLISAQLDSQFETCSVVDVNGQLSLLKIYCKKHRIDFDAVDFKDLPVPARSGGRRARTRRSDGNGGGNSKSQRTDSSPVKGTGAGGSEEAEKHGGLPEPTNQFPLHRLSSEGEDTELEELLDDQMLLEVNQKDTIGNTPLHYACYCNQYPTAKMLIERGGNIYSYNDKGQLPMDGFKSEVQKRDLIYFWMRTTVSYLKKKDEDDASAKILAATTSTEN